MELDSIDLLDWVAGFYVHSLSERPPENPGSIQKVIPGTNLKFIRSGGILFTYFPVNGEQVTKYLFGRKQEIGGKDPRFYRKSVGGGVRLERKFAPKQLDVSPERCLTRESNEELHREYRIRPGTVAPVNVMISPVNGVMQFLTAQLVKYPRVGTRKDACFEKQENFETRLRWLTIEDALLLSDSPNKRDRIPRETAAAVAAAYVFEKSQQVCFDPGDTSAEVYEDNTLAVDDFFIDSIVRKSGLSWFPRGDLAFCQVHYGVSNRPYIDPSIRDAIPYMQLFYTVGPFIHQVLIRDEELEGLSLPPDQFGEEDAELIAKLYTEEHYERILAQDLLKPYLMDAA